MIYLLPLVHLTLQSERKQEILPWGQNQLPRQVIAGCESTLSQKLSVSAYAWNSTIEMIDDCLGWMAKKKKMCILQLRCVSMWEFPGAQTQLKQWSWFKHSVSDGLLNCAALRWMAVSAAVDPQRLFGMRSRTRVATFSRQHQHAPVPLLRSNAAHSTAAHRGNKTSASSPLPRLPFQVTLRNCTLCFACSPQHTFL